MTGLNEGSNLDFAKLEELPYDLDKTNFRLLEDDDFREHGETLSGLLLHAAALVENPPENMDIRGARLPEYLTNLSETIQLFMEKVYLDSIRRQADVMSKRAIDPSDSGFPVVMRDIKYLVEDMEVAPSILERLPSSEQIVEGAITAMAHGKDPRVQRLEMTCRDYCEHLVSMQDRLPVKFRAHPIVEPEDRGGTYTATFERFDPRDNTPKLYTVFFRNTMGRLDYHTEQNIKLAIKNETIEVPEIELPHLAQVLESIEGVQVDTIQRVTVGPFFNQYTENPEDVQQVLDLSENGDGILFLSQSAIHRVGERKRRGFAEFFRSLMSNDWTLGKFSKQVEYPPAALMSHRLIQSAYRHGRHFSRGTRMYGIDGNGGLIG